MKCKICHHWFHTCGSCGLIDWEWEYCSYNCAKQDGIHDAFYEKQLEVKYKTRIPISKKVK